MKARVYVLPKTGVLDPQGKAIASALGRLGFEEIGDVRAGKVIDIELKDTDAAAARDRVKVMCEQLLANTVIENYVIEIVG
jgi:phosphoribosylformylglycinamidine synthase